MRLGDAEKLNLIKRTWNLEETGTVPYVIEVGRPHHATAAFYHDATAELAWHEEYHRRQSGLVDFYLPSLKPNMGISNLAAAFGCPLKTQNDADPWVGPLVSNQDPGAARQIRKPDTGDNPIYARMIERLAFLQANSPLPLRLVNVASPMVTASMIWNYTDLMMALLLHPGEVHALLEVITEATIDYVRLQLAHIRHLGTMGHEPEVLPPEIGLRVSDDTAALLSPALYREFAGRYNAKLAEAFGGVVVHSCGDCSRVVSAMLETPGLRGLELTMPQNKNWEAIKPAIGRVALSLRHKYWDHGPEAPDLVEYTRKMIGHFGRRGIFILTSTATFEEAHSLGQKLWPLLGPS
ncbi:MAG: uroporphyrinogen decarboxylase family protein [Thermodesulfobacteriota bacterium]